MHEGDTGRSITQEPIEIVLTPEELTPVLLATLRESIQPPIKDLFSLVDSNKGNIPDFAEDIHNASTDAVADVEQMLQISERALTGEPVQVVERNSTNSSGEPEDHSYLYLGPKKDGSDVSKESIKTIERVTPEHINRLLLGTVNNRTAQSLTPIGMYSGMISEDLDQNDPKKDTIDSIVNSTEKIGNDIQSLMAIGSSANKGQPIKVIARPTGQRILHLTPIKAA